MRLPISWLKELVPVKVKTSDLAHRLTMSGFEIEEVLKVEGEEVLEVNVTPNRGDCLSVAGLAREVAALFGKKILKPDSGKLTETKSKRFAAPLSVKVSARKGSPLYTLQAFEGISVKESPSWMADRLHQVGARPINNVVDITNYLLVERGQPLHAFDLNKIAGGKIFVRWATADEKFLALDGREHELTEEELVIADASGPIALAGIIGGKGTEVTEETKRIALEAAYFNPLTIRKSARRLGITTESSYRFERGIDPLEVVSVSRRAGSLLTTLTGGKAVGSLCEVRSEDFRPRPISLSPLTLRRLLGIEWKDSQIRGVFSRLGFVVTVRQKEWKVLVPPYRHDLQEEIDLIEEVLRLLGIESVPRTFPPLKSGAQEVPSDFSSKRLFRRSLEEGGLSEAIHFSFTNREEVGRVDPSLSTQGVVLANPLGEEDSLLRPSLIPSLLKTVSYHHRHKIFQVRLFELRPVFLQGGKKVIESERLGIVLSGESLFQSWKQKGGTDFFELKGILERGLARLGIGEYSFVSSSLPFLHPGKGARLMVAGEEAGIVGEVHPAVAGRFDLKRTTFVAEIDWTLLAGKVQTSRHFQPYSLFPMVDRDLSLLVDESVPATVLLLSIRRAGGTLLQEVRIFDLFAGGALPAGKKSLGFSLKLGRRDRTLTDSEVAEIYGKIVGALKAEYKVEVR